MRVLLTGGCGFIGSHQAVVLLEAGHDVVIVDDLSNSRANVVERIEEVAGAEIELAVLDVCNTAAMVEVMTAMSCEVIIHFAGMKHVAESMERPVEYLNTNVAGLTSVMRAAELAGVRKLIFSSSGSIYGATPTVPIPEDAPIAPSNPYSRSKAICEEVLATICAVDDGWSVMALRYFNPAGAHQSGVLGEDPTHLRTNIVPALMDVAVGQQTSLTINGTGFDTIDGSCVRDYIHVMDVAVAHARALDAIEGTTGFRALNIGRGEGVSVRQLIAAAEHALGVSIPFVEGPPRPGDVPALVADTTASRAQLGSIEYRDIETIFTDAWRFRSRLHG
jgi:UDP-glucose 4-epimerase